MPSFQLLRDNRLKPTIPFRGIHAAVRPGATAGISADANFPVAEATHITPSARPQPVVASTHVSEVQDLLGFDGPASNSSAQTAQVQQSPASADDVFGIFGGLAVASPGTSAPPPQQQPPVAQQQYGAQGQQRPNPQVSATQGSHQPHGFGLLQPSGHSSIALPHQQQRIPAQPPGPPPASMHMMTPPPVQTPTQPMPHMIAARPTPGLPPPPQGMPSSMVPVGYHPGAPYGRVPPPTGAYGHPQQPQPSGPGFPGQHVYPPQQQLQYSGQAPQPPHSKPNLSQFDPMAR